MTVTAAAATATVALFIQALPSPPAAENVRLDNHCSHVLAVGTVVLECALPTAVAVADADVTTNIDMVGETEPVGETSAVGVGVIVAGVGDALGLPSVDVFDGLTEGAFDAVPAALAVGDVDAAASLGATDALALGLRLPAADGDAEAAADGVESGEVGSGVNAGANDGVEDAAAVDDGEVAPAAGVGDGTTATHVDRAYPNMGLAEPPGATASPFAAAATVPRTSKMKSALIMALPPMTPPPPPLL